MAKAGFIAELRRRHVVRVAIAYVVVSWLLLQLGAIVFPALHAPSWCESVLLAFLVLGFPVAVLLAWAFEATPEGVRRTESAEAEAAQPAGYRRHVGRVLNVGIIVVLAAAVSILLWRQFEMGSKRQAAASRAVHAAQAAGTTSGTVVAASAPGPRIAISAKSIAVLPFANDSSDANQRYFSDGLSESFIIALSQYPALTVIGRESSFQLRHTTLDSMLIGKKLGVANLLEGSVSREGGEVRIRAELVSTTNGRTLWSEQYDRPYKNLFALQDAITKAVAAALKEKLLGSKKPGAVVQTDRPPSGSLAAYNAYLQGNFYSDRLNPKSVRQGIAYYEEAIQQDSKYTAAYAGLSIAWSHLSALGMRRVVRTQAYVKARAAAETALKLDSDSSIAHVALGAVLMYTLHAREAEDEFRRALALDPSSPAAKRLLGFSLAILGRLREAVQVGQAAIAANPLEPYAYIDCSRYLSGLEQWAAAAHYARRAIELQPAVAILQLQLAVIEVHRGDAKAALADAEALPTSGARSFALALAYKAAGEKVQAGQALQRLIANYADQGAYYIADVYAYRQDPDRTFAWLDRAWHLRDPSLRFLLFDPFLLRYKHDPRFAALCRKLNLPVPGSAPTAATRS